MQKYLVFDIDGTLIEKGDITCDKATEDLLKLATSHGIKITTSTGRGWPGVEKTNLHKLFDASLMLELGSKIYDPKKDAYLTYHGLEIDDAAVLLNQLRVEQENVAISYWGEDWTRYLFSQNDKLIDKYQKIYTPAKVVVWSSVAELIDNLRFSKPTFLRINGVAVDMINTDQLSLSLHPFSLKNGGFEVTAKNIDKASGLKEFMELEGVSADQVYFIGNSKRDLVVTGALGENRIVIINDLGRRLETIKRLIHSIIEDFGA